MTAIALAERQLVPDWLIRRRMRDLLRERLQQEQSLHGESPSAAVARFAALLRQSPVTTHVDAANQQHYEVPAEFFVQALGPRLKYSCGLWPGEDTTLAESEEAMLRLTCQRAAIVDGMQILELGCGWGSLTLWMAEQYPASRIVAVSNSHGQREFIQQCCRSRGLTNVEVRTCDVSKLQLTESFDRVVSVEMFEHVRNYAVLLHNIRHWLRPDGKLFVHIFCHRRFAYAFETDGDNDWMARHFFTGGIMPSRDLLSHFQQDLQLVQQWDVNGRHYARTCEAWLSQVDSRRDEALAVLSHDVSRGQAKVRLQRWRMFFMACAELFNYDTGEQWQVGHYLFEKIR